MPNISKEVQEYITDNTLLLDGVDPLIIEQIFQAGRLDERNNTLDLIARGVLHTR